MKICIFCSANSNIDPDFFAATEELGRWAAAEGHTVVFGGCDMGLMECIGRTARENGARTIGVVPTKVEERGRTSRHIDVHIPCDNLSDRKDLMTAQSDVFIALPEVWARSTRYSPWRQQALSATTRSVSYCIT